MLCPCSASKTVGVNMVSFEENAPQKLIIDFRCEMYVVGVSRGL